MGREVRRVPADWQHPKDERGEYKPLLDGFLRRLKRWNEENAKWQEGLEHHYDFSTKPWWVPAPAEALERGGIETWVPKPEGRPLAFTDWDGAQPSEKDYMPDWPESERTHWQMYECTSEGTPISPVMESPEALARWLADNEASAFADQTASYEGWLRVCLGGYAPSAVIRGGVAQSGVDALTAVRGEE